MANDESDDQSDKKPDSIEILRQQMAVESEYNTLKKEAARNKILLDHARSSAELERQRYDLADLEILRTANFGIQSPERIAEIQKENTEYMLAAKSKYHFMIRDPEKGPAIGFDALVPFFRKNLLLFGARTGDGKSTGVANIAYSLLFQKSKHDGSNAKILIISNEERKEDVYNRITCLLMGWSYTSHSKFTDAQIKRFNDNIPALASRITVIDDGHEGAHGATSSVDGIEAIFQNLLDNKTYYDCVLIDYYQNVTECKKNLKMNEYEVQARLSRILDKYKNLYPAPIILFCQVNPDDEEESKSFYWRIQGRKLIMTVATFVMEMKVDKQKRTTKWVIHKNRFSPEGIGGVINTHFKDGKFIPYSHEYAAEINSKLDKQRNDELNLEKDTELNKKNALPDVVVKGEENE